MSMPRVVTEWDEDERPCLSHAVRRATAAAALEGFGSQYLTLCGEVLYAESKRLARKRGVPTCLRCTLAACEEAAL